LIMVAAIAVLAFACSESVGGMLEDAGQMMMDAGDMLQPDAGAQDTPASCDKSDGSTRWAEFPVNAPGQTEVTVCYRANPDTVGPRKRAYCQRFAPPYYEGTSTGFLYSCDDNVTSITVHN